MRSIIDFYRESPVTFVVALVAAILLAVAVLSLGEGSPIAVIVLGVVAGLVAGAAISLLRGRGRR